jgi:peroxiredoxin
VIALVVVSVAIPGALFAIASRDTGGESPLTPGTLGGVPTKAEVGSVAPDFTLRGVDQKEYTLSEFRGRPVVLNFFASWCNPCEKEMPALEEVHRAEGDRVAIVGVNYKDFGDDTRRFVQRLGVTFPALLEDANKNPVAAAYDVHAMPDTVFIDAEGVVRERLYGQSSPDDVRAGINRLLAD